MIDGWLPRQRRLLNGVILQASSEAISWPSDSIAVGVYHGVQTPTNHREGGVCLRACWGAWGLPFGLPEQRRGYGHEGMPGRKKGHTSKLATMLRKLELEIHSISAYVPLLRLVRRLCPSRC